MDINLIITCFDKEEYLLGLVESFKLFKKIKFNTCLCYNGKIDAFPCDIRLKNNGHQLGDIELTMAGYRQLKGNGVTRFIKIAIDSWLLDEDVLFKIFEGLEINQSAYAGNYWFSENSPSLATDIIFTDTRFGNIFENFKWDGNYFESSLYKTVLDNSFKISIISERIPANPNHRFNCKKLGWTMSHELIENLENLWKFQKEHH